MPLLSPEPGGVGTPMGLERGLGVKCSTILPCALGASARGDGRSAADGAFGSVGAGVPGEGDGVGFSALRRYVVLKGRNWQPKYEGDSRLRNARLNGALLTFILKPGCVWYFVKLSLVRGQKDLGPGKTSPDELGPSAGDGHQSSV